MKYERVCISYLIVVKGGIIAEGADGGQLN